MSVVGSRSPPIATTSSSGHSGGGGNDQRLGPTGCGRVERAVLLEVAPEDERVSAVAVWARREQVARLDDRCARTGRVLCDTQLLFDVLRIDTGSAAGDTRDDRRRPQVHEHVPRLAQHDRLLAPDAVGLGEGDCGVNALLDIGEPRERTDVRIGDWSLVQSGARYAARIAARDFTLDLALSARAPILLQGDDGVSRKGPHPLDASYYYSRPHLQVEGSVASGARARRVTGSAWLDHEWSSRYLTHGGVGWDWIGINLDDGGALMAFRIRDSRGEPLWAGGTHRDAHGARRTFAPAEIAFVPQRRWRSPRTGVEYPVSFDVRAGDVALLLEPLFPDQELDARAGVGAVYWEGAVRATGPGGIAGRGYLELTGYAGALRI